MARFARRRNLTFLASETVLGDSGFCFADFQYVTILRDPVERLHSQLTHMFSASPNAQLHRILKRTSLFNTSERSSLMGTASVDNYLIRILLGPPAFFLPLGAINSTHLEEADHILSKFTLAIPLENLTTTGAAMLRGLLGWEGDLPRANRHTRLSVRRGGSMSTMTATRGRRLAYAARPLGVRNLGLLRSLNKHDIRLVEMARLRFEAQHREISVAGPAAGGGAARRVFPQHACRRQCPTGKIGWQLGVI